ncbi:MAG: hypothetical protein A3C30_00865 [Candidatus Levybacteria bacterium RIFCSPHIGHO2_02_FULL_40_18]|nr:MAG: hypothetical protein A2869_03070 [Candidatus Levybacteria bacterium RIFCSPHIGHO2_01_FULL_40_58]OGH27249.1 MAG: hypothetical protein A3C30_00865 [Candidatus Levybacteria bacterium RIFCSPHIGHO2_02_FULL_40_18]OGH31108.1 MAG: hypothetical protein A3E43_05275 [Candidatus Levybacteria bacterium RIFCSPHIGHO2_12_FULL_40_31]OGH40724.1 MAG: hypothetical protein A2894_03165 [Candidatus Levybacteria bacterium RIFCSPLOWO2_01_FULL_40_64]OGH49363.1 MAG: hypothetical protein A3I54_01805 [Candidatus Lev
MGVENESKIVSGVGERKYLPDGWSVISEIPNPIIDSGVVTDEVDEHEGNHLLVAAELGVSIIEGSVIPEGDSLGHVKTGHFSAPVAMAAHADGGRGTGHDRLLVRLHGDNEDSAAAVAKDIIRRKPKHKKALAILLHKEKVVNGSRVHSELAKVDQGETVETTVVDPDGKQHKIITMGIHEGDKVEVSIKDLLPLAA